MSQRLTDALSPHFTYANPRGKKLAPLRGLLSVRVATVVNVDHRVVGAAACSLTRVHAVSTCDTLAHNPCPIVEPLINDDVASRKAHVNRTNRDSPRRFIIHDRFLSGVAVGLNLKVSRRRKLHGTRDVEQRNQPRQHTVITRADTVSATGTASRAGNSAVPAVGDGALCSVDLVQNGNQVLTAVVHNLSHDVNHLSLVNGVTLRNDLFGRLARLTATGAPRHNNPIHGVGGVTVLSAVVRVTLPNVPRTAVGAGLRQRPMPVTVDLLTGGDNAHVHRARVSEFVVFAGHLGSAVFTGDDHCRIVRGGDRTDTAVVDVAHNVTDLVNLDVGSDQRHKISLDHARVARKTVRLSRLAQCLHGHVSERHFLTPCVVFRRATQA